MKNFVVLVITANEVLYFKFVFRADRFRVWEYDVSLIFKIAMLFCQDLKGYSQLNIYLSRSIVLVLYCG